MPRRDDLDSILIIGSGPIVIGQACEFDYSGTQACKVLREDGFKVILVNSNPATIMTDPEFADRTYVEPITPEIVEAMGVHTGDSITVAPAQTLTDREYQVMRDRSIACIREIGVETGGSNIQFAVDPKTGRQVIIEMNPRVSRSSALASKATGFPIAKIAAKLAVGYTLDEITNDITRETPASFEPTLDYTVVKVPRFAFEKFPGADPTLTTTMKSVGEAMALGRSFGEALGKALRSMETSAGGFWTRPDPEDTTLESALAAAATPTDGR